MFFIGIDEAGYGPMLGPLVVGGVMLRCACQPQIDYLWKDLGKVITSKPRRKDARLVVCDSKMLSTRPDGLPLLETAGLVAARLSGTPNGTWRDLLTALDPQVGEHLAASPWDAEGDTALPCACKPDSLAIQASAVRTAAQRAGCSFESAPSRAGFLPRTSLERGLEEVLDHFLAHAGHSSREHAPSEASSPEGSGPGRGIGGPRREEGH